MADNINQYELIPSNKGGYKLAYQGHVYNHHHTSKSGPSTYRCFNYKKFKCKGWAKLHNNAVTITQEHAYPCIPAPTDIKIQMFNANLSAAALKNPKITPKSLVNDAVQNLDQTTKNRIVSIERIVKRVNKLKRRHNGQPTRQQIDIPDELRTTKTTTPENFLLHDTGIGDLGRIIVFGSDTDVQRLVASQTWLVDGTFDVNIYH